MLRDTLDVDVVLAGDVCYERSKALGVLAWLRAHAARGAFVLLADPHRGFFQLADEPGVELLETRMVRANADVEGRGAEDDAVARALELESGGSGPGVVRANRHVVPWESKLPRFFTRRSRSLHRAGRFSVRKEK